MYIYEKFYPEGNLDEAALLLLEAMISEELEAPENLEHFIKESLNSDVSFVEMKGILARDHAYHERMLLLDKVEVFLNKLELKRIVDMRNKWISS
jgi:hypothetical protein